jgi:uncharacterized protein YbaA (DUF1428 family)
MTKAKYVDGFVLVIPKEGVTKYKKIAAEAAKVWKKFGALSYRECMGQDLEPKMGDKKSVLFPKLTKAGPEDTVWFSYIEYKNKKHRDTVTKKVMEYFAKKYGENMDMPFDMKKFSYGGFSIVVS